jgi:hypothetical protein
VPLEGVVAARQRHAPLQQRRGQVSLPALEPVDQQSLKRPRRLRRVRSRRQRLQHALGRPARAATRQGAAGPVMAVVVVLGGRTHPKKQRQIAEAGRAELGVPCAHPGHGLGLSWVLGRQGQAAPALPDQPLGPAAQQPLDIP